jgi:DNA-binding MarR family transcriptional regulator
VAAVDTPTSRSARELTALADAMRRLQRLGASRRVHAALSEATGVELPQQALQVLSALDGTMSVAELARAAHMDVGAVSRQLRLLEVDGYVRKSASPDNASVVLVTATSRGRAAARRVFDVRNRHLERALAEWPTRDRRELAALLQRLVDDLQRTPYTGSRSHANGDRP